MSARLRTAVCVLLLLLAHTRSAAAAASRAVLQVSTSGELLRALRDSNASTIELLNDVALEEGDFGQFEAAPLLVNRSVTLTSAGRRRGGGRPPPNPDAMAVIDLRHLPGILEICGTCHFAFQHINIAHENSIGTGLGMSVFRGHPGSRLSRLGGVGLRTACPATEPTLKILNSTQRSLLFPNPRGQQLASATDFVFRGKRYTDMLRIIDLSSDIPLVVVANSSFSFGYAIHRANATRLCDHIVSAQCLSRQTAELCVADFIAAASNGDSSNSGGGSAGGSPQRAAAIGVPVAVGGALLLAAAGALVLRRRRSRKQRSNGQAKPQAAPDKPSKGHLPGAACGPDIESPADQQPARAAVHSSAGSVPADRAVAPQAPQQSDSGTWQLLSASVAPGMAFAENDPVELGVMLGAGSYARVYRAKWAGLDVAVKVIQHHTSGAQDVANEVGLMLRLNHPNIVRAYHCITKQLISEHHAAACGAGAPTRQALGSGSSSNTRAVHPPSAAGAMLQSHGNGSRSLDAQPLSLPASPGRSRGAAAAAAAPTLAGSASAGRTGSGCLPESRHVQDLEPTPVPRWQQQPSSGSLLPAAGLARSSNHRTVSSGAWPVIDSSAGVSAAGEESGSAGAAGGVAAIAEAEFDGELCETWLVQELMNRGTLARQVTDWRPKENEQHMLWLLLLLRDVACGLKLLHTHNIVHADLNAHNVLCNTSAVAQGGVGLVAKISDLGLSRILKQHATHRTTRTVGMVTHQPPELLQFGRTSPAVDVYSFGVMMYEVLTRQVAFARMLYGQIYTEVVLRDARPPVPDDTPGDYTLLMQRCWATEPKERPTVDLLLACLEIMIQDRRREEQQQGDGAASSR